MERLGGWWRLFIVAASIWAAVVIVMMLDERGSQIKGNQRIHADKVSNACRNIGPNGRSEVIAPTALPQWSNDPQTGGYSVEGLDKLVASASNDNKPDVAAFFRTTSRELRSQVDACVAARAEPVEMPSWPGFILVSFLCWAIPTGLLLAVVATGRWVWQGFSRPST